MDYEKKYKETLERAKMYHNNAKAAGDCSAVARYENIFPGLRESEDERIRKELITYHKGMAKVNEETCNPNNLHTKWVTYLEKQKELFESGKGLYYYDGEKTTYCGYPAVKGNPYDFALSQQKEQKPAEWSEKDEHRFISCLARLQTKYGTPTINSRWFEQHCSKYSHWRPTEEDERIRGHIIDVLTYCAKNHISITEAFIKRDIDWLKSLHPQHHWKPSEQEKGALRTAIHILTDEGSFPKAAAHLQHILDVFEDEEPRKDWKPTEEQMAALEYFVQKHKAEANAVTNVWIDYENLVSLRNDLKKL